MDELENIFGNSSEFDASSNSSNEEKKELNEAIVPNTLKISKKDPVASEIPVQGFVNPTGEKDSDVSEKLVSSVIKDVLALQKGGTKSED